MRQLTLYEEAQELNKMKVGMKKNNDTKTTASKAANDETGRGKKSAKPTEPDWDELRDAFERESGIEEVDTLEILAQHCWSEVFKLIKLMHRFAQRMVDITAQQMQQSGINARDLVQQSGKITSAALQMIRVQKVIYFSKMVFHIIHLTTFINWLCSWEDSPLVLRRKMTKLMAMRKLNLTMTVHYVRKCAFILTPS